MTAEQAPALDLEVMAKHYDDLAASEAAQRDYDVSTFGHSPNSYNARIDTYRRTAQALRLEVETGRAHCSCCLSPENWHE